MIGQPSWNRVRARGLSSSPAFEYLRACERLAGRNVESKDLYPSTLLATTLSTPRHRALCLPYDGPYAYHG